MVVRSVLSALATRGNDQVPPWQQLAWGVVFVVMSSANIIFRRRLWPSMQWKSRTKPPLDADEWGEGRGLYLLSYVVVPSILILVGAYMIVDAIHDAR